MLKIGIQFFAHKKGGGSTKNGRDSESKRLGVKRADGQFVLAGNILVKLIPAQSFTITKPNTSPTPPRPTSPPASQKRRKRPSGMPLSGSTRPLAARGSPGWISSSHTKEKM